MDIDLIKQEFLIRDWLFIKMQDHFVLVDEEDEYISFVSNQLFNNVAFLLYFNKNNETLFLKEVVQQAKTHKVDRGLKYGNL